MSKSKLIVANIQYQIKKHDNIFTAKLLSDTYENAEWYLRKLILKQLKKRNVQANLDDAISVQNRSILCEIDAITDSAKTALLNEKKVEL